jgi:hypothetical protein
MSAVAEARGSLLELSEREEAVLKWRDETDQKLPYRHIAARIGVSTHRARQIYLSAKQKLERSTDPYWTQFKGLTGKEYAILFFQNIGSREEGLKAFRDGRLKVFKSGAWHNDGVRGIGQKTYRRLAQWAGYEIPPRPPKKPKLCPHCGGQL